MNKVILLTTFLLLSVSTKCAEADPIKIVSANGRNSATVEIVGADAKFLKIKGTSTKMPLALLDRDSLIRVIGELGRQLEASPKSTPLPKVDSAGSTIELRYIKSRSKNGTTGSAKLFFEVTNTTKFFLETVFPKLLVYDKKGEYIGSDGDYIENLRVGQKSILDFSISNCRLEEIGSVKFEWTILSHEDQNGKKYDIRRAFTPKATGFP